MGFSPMDGFFLAVFMAVCILVAVIIRCICYRCCMQSCSDKFGRSNDDNILPRHTTPTITPAGHHQRPQQQQEHSLQMLGHSQPVLPAAGTVFTIYTFPQQPSPELERPDRNLEISKYSSLHSDPPPKYEDLFPLDAKDTTDLSPNSIEMQVTRQQSLEEEPQTPTPESGLLQTSASSTSFCSPRQTIVPVVPSSISLPLTNQPPSHVPREAPPLYDTICPQKSGE